jgi:hypothetical protein
MIAELAALEEGGCRLRLNNASAGMLGTIILLF